MKDFLKQVKKISNEKEESKENGNSNGNDHTNGEVSSL
jgi:hypothetical protein